MCPICEMWVRLQAGTGDQSSEFIPVSPVLLSTAHSPGAELEAKYLPCQYTDTKRQTEHTTTNLLGGPDIEL